MYKKFIIAIDGPAGSGKSTTAKKVAESLHFLYIDTGAMYRAITYLAMTGNFLEDEAKIIGLAENVKIDLKFINGKTFLSADNVDISEEIRSIDVNNNVSQVSKISGVRKALVKKQQDLAVNNSGVVIEGRDVTTVVFPKADIKIFLTAGIKERAERRLKEYEEKNVHVSLDEIKNNIQERDRIDSTRADSPLTKAEDALEIDTSSITIDEQVDIILNKVKDFFN
ncbi:MAG: (d)CMP kinase [Bacteroidota bacterium]|nr:(d)CMP kinase [Bacteroidota bacterium]